RAALFFVKLSQNTLACGLCLVNHDKREWLTEYAGQVKIKKGRLTFSPAGLGLAAAAVIAAAAGIVGFFLNL
ncbi:MAG TPA: hypothetical protein VK885_01980, partial [Desulfotignum sp.]|nr:hypothetical protein [Desulfotignum sp.]